MLPSEMRSKDQQINELILTKGYVKIKLCFLSFTPDIQPKMFPFPLC